LDNMTAREMGARLQLLWTRRACLVAGLGLACSLPAAAAAIHRIIAVGDLHGDFSAWRDIALAAGLVDGLGRWSGGSTILVQTGDVVDRGPDSLEIVQDLMRLQQEAARDGGQVIAMVGNHEAMNMTGDLRYLSAADYAAYVDNSSLRRRERIYAANETTILAAYRKQDPQMSEDAVRQAWFAVTPLGSIEHRIAWRPDGKIGKWVAGNPAVVVLDGTLFVHGGISPAYAHMPAAEINARVAAALMAQSVDPKAIINDPAGPLWYRGLATPTGDAAPAEADGTAPSGPPVAEQLDALLPAFGARRIVIGHTPILSGIAVLEGGRLFRIDTGITRVYGGKLSYLEILDGNPVPHAVQRSPIKQGAL
jgi:hypothetical protein